MLRRLAQQTSNSMGYPSQYNRRLQQFLFPPPSTVVTTAFEVTNRILFSQQSLKATTKRSLSTTTADGSTTDTIGTGSESLSVTDNDIIAGSRHKQPFVDDSIPIRPREWDPARKDPLYRPIYNSQTSIISAEDYAKQPTVSFTGEYESFGEAMVTLSWLTHDENELIYNAYCEILQDLHDMHNRTSHEYVVRLLAQELRLSSERVAAIIQLQHNQEQMVARGEKLCTEAANYMDTEIRNVIKEAYEELEGDEEPDSFIEDPVGAGQQESKTYVTMEDVFDSEAMLEDVTVRDAKRAQMIIDDYVYIEDVDDHSVIVPIDNTCKKLLQKKEEIAKEVMEDITTVQAKKKISTKTQKKKKKNIDLDYKIPYKETAGNGKKRDRCKYIAQIVNTRELKRQHSKHKSYTNNSVQNTLVELDGVIRPATLEEVKFCSWKPVRNLHEHTYRTAKKGWLDRINRNKANAWGPQGSKEQSTHDAQKILAAELSDEEIDDNVVDDEQVVIDEDIEDILNDDDDSIDEEEDELDEEIEDENEEELSDEEEIRRKKKKAVDDGVDE